MIAAALFVAAILVRVPLLARPGFPADQTQFVIWAEGSHAHGLAGAYQPKADGGYTCNYPPAYLYALRTLAQLQNALAPADARLTENTARAIWRGEDHPAARWAIILHKLPATLADGLLTALLFVCLVPRWRERSAILIAALYALSPAVLYDSSVWGQIDAIPTLLMVASLELARRGRIVAMTCIAVLALLTKAQCMMVAPIWVAVGWQWVRHDPLKRTAALTAACIGVAGVVLLPFVDRLDAVKQAYVGAASYYPYTHLNGFSAWWLGAPLTEPHLGERLSQWYLRDDIPGLLHITPRTWGLLGVLAMWAIVWNELRRRRCDEGSLQWAARFLPLGFFVLSTQMHERYLIPAIGLWAWAAAPTIRWWVSWLVLAICSGLNISWAWPGPHDAPWTQTLQTMLHRPWLGASLGTWCAVALVAVLMVTILSRPRMRDSILRG